MPHQTITLEKYDLRYKVAESDLYLDVPIGERDYILKIRDMPVDAKPREKLIECGPSVLSVEELLAVILTTGTQREDVLELSKRIIRQYGEKVIVAEHSPERLRDELDISIVKACQIVAVGELGRRFYAKNDSGFTVIRTAKDVYDHVVDMRRLPKDHLRGLYLNSHNQIIHDEVISIGTINSNIVHPREVFRPAVEYNAVAVVLAHNHPSGIAAPSAQDIEVTKQLADAGKVMGIHLLDHVIITEQGFSSIKINY